MTIKLVSSSKHEWEAHPTPLVDLHRSMRDRVIFNVIMHHQQSMGLVINSLGQNKCFKPNVNVTGAMKCYNCWG